MKNTKTISIIVPIYNAEMYLKRCIKSILNQTFKNFELLLIDDGSTDRSGTICGEFASQDERVRVFHQANKGVSSARNVGLKEACGEWIGFVDSDDFCDINMFEKMYEQTKPHEVDMVICGYKRIYANEKSVIVKKIEPNAIILNSKVAIKSIFTKHQLSSLPCDKLYRANLVKRDSVVFDENVSFGEDLLFLYEVLKKSKKIVVIEDKLYSYFENQNSAVFEKSPIKRVSGLKVYKKILKETKDLDIAQAIEENLLNYRVSLAIFCKFSSIARHKKYSDSLKNIVLKKIFKILFSTNLTTKQKIITIAIYFPKIFIFALKVKKRITT